MNTAAIIIEGGLWLLRCCISAVEACERRRNVTSDDSEEERSQSESETKSESKRESTSESESSGHDTFGGWAREKLTGSPSVHEFGNFINNSFALFQLKCTELDRKFGFECIDGREPNRRRFSF